MWRLIKLLLFLAVFGGILLVAYAYVGPFLTPADFAAPQDEITIPVTLEAE